MALEYWGQEEEGQLKPVLKQGHMNIQWQIIYSVSHISTVLYFSNVFYSFSNLALMDKQNMLELVL